MRKLFTLCLLIVSLSGISQWQQTGSKVRYVNGLGIPTKDTAAGVLADSSQILIRPQDSALYVKYKRTWLRVGGGTVSGTTNRVSKFTGATTVGNSSIVDSASAVAMTINPSGNVGIGTPNLGANGLSLSNVYNLSFSEGSGESYANIFRQRNTVATVIAHSLKRSSTANFASSFTGSIGKAAIAVGFDNGSISFFSDPASNVANGTDFTATERMRITSGGNALIGTTTDNGVDRLQVSGSGLFNGSGVIGKFDGTSTNNAYIDFRTSGTPKWQLGNNAASSHDFNLTNSATSVNSMVVNSSNQIGFNMQGAFLAANSALEFHKTSSQFINRQFAWNSSGLGVTFDTRSTRSNTWGSYSATLSGDPIFQFFTNGSDNSAHRLAGFFGYYQDGSTTTTATPGYWTIESNSGSQQGRTKIKIDGTSDFIGFYTSSNGVNSFGGEKVRITSSGRVLMGSTLPTDNGTDALQVNGSIQGTGFNQAYTAKTTTYTATTSDYFIDCTSGTFTVNLFTAVGNTGRILIIKNSGTGTITVDPNGSQTIDGATTQTLSTQWSRVHIISDGANWKIISN